MVRKKAFSLIELLVVVAIIGVLAAIAFISYASSQKKSRDSQRIRDLGEVANALQLYNDKIGGFPANVITTPEGNGHACNFPYGTDSPADPDWWVEGCLEGKTTATAVKGLVTEGILLKLPKDPRYPDYSYAYYNYGSYAILKSVLEAYSGTGLAGSFRFPAGDTKGWCVSESSNEYCIKVLP